MQKNLIFVLLILTICLGAFSVSASEKYHLAVSEYQRLYSNKMDQIKVGSRPFLLLQNKPTKTVLMIHGLSDSPGSMQEVGQIYYRNGYNVVTVLLRDHGLSSLTLRDQARSEIELAKWREDIDYVLKLALDMSDDNKVALIGYSMGGALSIDTFNRYPQKISSIVMMAPMFKMMYSSLTGLTKVMKHVVYSTKKGIDEMPHFYPDIALNQTFHASRLAKYLRKKVLKRPSKKLKKLPKLMFLTEADTTINNKYALKAAKRMDITGDQLVLYPNNDSDNIVLHRDLPMRYVNATGSENQHLDNLLNRLDRFLVSLNQ